MRPGVASRCGSSARRRHRQLHQHTGDSCEPPSPPQHPDIVVVPLRQNERTASYSVNERAVARARELIESRQYVVRSEWGEVQPSAADQDRYLTAHTLGGVRQVAPGAHGGCPRRHEGKVRVRLRGFSSAASLGPDRLPLPRGGVGPQGDRARRARSAAGARQDARLASQRRVVRRPGGARRTLAGVS